MSATPPSTPPSLSVKLPPLENLPSGQGSSPKGPRTPRTRSKSIDAVYQIGGESISATRAAALDSSPRMSSSITPKQMSNVRPNELALIAALRKQKGGFRHRMSQVELAQAIQDFILRLLERASQSDRVDALGLLDSIRKARDIPALCFKDPEEVVNLYKPNAPVSLQTLYPLFADALAEQNGSSEKGRVVFGQFNKKQKLLIAKELQRWAEPQVERPRHWDERTIESLPKDLNDKLPKPLAEANFEDLIRSGLYHKKVIFPQTQIDLSSYDNYENWIQQTAFLTQLAKALVEHGFLQSSEPIPFYIAQMRWVHNVCRGVMNEIPAMDLAERVRSECLPHLSSDQASKIESFIGMLWMLQSLATAQRNSEGLLAALNIGIKSIFTLYPNPLLKALIPFNIGSYSNFHNLIKRAIPLTLKIDQKEGLILHIPSPGELCAEIPQNYKIMSKDGLRVLGSLQTAMLIESDGAHWRGKLTIKAATLFKEATNQEKLEILSVLAAVHE
jgi:hypothetical protein